MRRLLSTLKQRLLPPSETLEGYENPELIETIFRKTVAHIPSGEAPSVASASSVLDFGGGCGFHYKEARSASVRWAVVDTPAMVDRAQELATDRLQFFKSVDAAADWLGSIDAVHSSGALQYTSAPKQTLAQLCELGAARMLWYRLFLREMPTSETQRSMLSENGPGAALVANKAVEYVRTSISEREFLDAHAGYRLDRSGDDWFEFHNLR